MASPQTKPAAKDPGHCIRTDCSINELRQGFRDLRACMEKCHLELMEAIMALHAQNNARMDRMAREQWWLGGILVVALVAAVAGWLHRP